MSTATLKKIRKSLMETQTLEQQFGESTATMILLIELSNGEPDRVTTIAERVGITQQAVGKTITRLAEKGWLTQDSDPTDGRARMVQLTKRGTDVVDFLGALWE